MSFSNYYGTNRTLCDVLEEIRGAHKNHNYSYLPSLVDEAQSMANRMEAKLYDIKDWKQLEIDCKKLKKELKELESAVGAKKDSPK